MPYKKRALNVKKQYFDDKNPQKLAVFKVLPEPFGSMYFNET